MSDETKPWGRVSGKLRRKLRFKLSDAIENLSNTSLTPVASRDRTQTPLDSTQSSWNHVLEPEDERRMSDTLAYFSVQAKGGDGVIGVMVQEHHNLEQKSTKLEILIAGNQQPPAATEKLLSSILSTMAKAKTPSWHHLHKEMSPMVIGHCSRRIDERIDSLLETKCAQHKTLQSWLYYTDDDRFRSLMRSAHDLSKALATTSEPSSLSHRHEIVEICSRITTDPDPTSEISCKPRLLLDVVEYTMRLYIDDLKAAGQNTATPNLPKFSIQGLFRLLKYVHNIRQMGRYDTGCWQLLEMASRYPSLFSKDTNTVCNVNKKFANANGVFHNKSNQIHAEVYLAVYRDFGELHTRPENQCPQPRFIGCNKSACYMCEEFLKVQGRYRTSRAHNRIYEKWNMLWQGARDKLAKQQLQQIVGQLVKQLDAEIAKGNKATDNHRRESLASPLSPSFAESLKRMS